MKGIRLSPRLAPLLLGLLLLATVAHAGPVGYLDQFGKVTVIDNPAVTDAVSALNALAGGPSRLLATLGLSSAVPRGTVVLDTSLEGNTYIVNFSGRLTSSGLDEMRIEAIFNQVKWTLYYYGIEIDLRILVEGEPLATFLKPTPFIEPHGVKAEDGLIGTDSLSGRSITLSPGHGIFWNGSGWYTQRPVYCAPLSEEDLHNLDHALYLTSFLEADGMLVKKVRCHDKGFGQYLGFDWWKMASPYWLQNVGYPCSVYGSYSGCSLGDGASESSDDIRARPLASDYDNTNIYISLHTNGSAGNCYGGSCPTGTDTYYDCVAEHNAWCTVSSDLANAVHPSLINAIRNEVGDSGWVDRGRHDSNGAYGEIRIPDRAAILIELGFHDSCDLDAVKMKDHFWTSGAMWGIYRGICTYFGTTPTWGFYSSEYVSDTIPATMAPSEVRQVSITLRDRGVLWNEAKSFRLGAVGDSDPFTGTTRHTISGEVNPGGTYTFTFNLTAPSVEGPYITDWQMVRDGVTWFGATVTKSIQVGGAPDTEAPTVPTNLSATPVSPNQINLSWTASTDNFGVAGYKVFRNGGYLNSTTNTSYSDTTCASNTTYSYAVSAYDAALNESAQCAPVQATTPAITDFIIDNPQATFTGSWSTGTSSVDKYGADYRFIGTQVSETGTAIWRPNIEEAGGYDVSCWYPAGANRTTAAPYIVYWNGGSQQVNMNQQSGGGAWHVLVSNKSFLTGTAGYLKVGNATGEASLVVMADAARFFQVSGGPDTEAPTVPTNLNATAISGTRVDLTWTASTDNVGVTGYKVFRDSAQVGTSPTASYSDTTCSPNTTYSYTVSAYDAALNESAQSAPDVVTTPPSGPQTKDYAPTAITITRGSIGSGSVTNLGANDASYLRINSVKVGSARQVDWYSSVTIAEPRTSVTKLTINFDSHLSASLTQVLYLYNFTTSAWVQIDSRTVGATDVLVSWNTTSPLNYISATGEMRVRQFVTRTSNFSSYADFTQYNIEYN